MRCRSPTKCMRWQEWPVQFERRSAVPGKFRRLINNSTEPVRAQEQFYHQNGINSVPAVIINERHLISGGQPPEVFEQALRQIIAGA